MIYFCILYSRNFSLLPYNCLALKISRITKEFMLFLPIRYENSHVSYLKECWCEHCIATIIITTNFLWVPIVGHTLYASYFAYKISPNPNKCLARYVLLSSFYRSSNHVLVRWRSFGRNWWSSKTNSRLSQISCFF